MSQKSEAEASDNTNLTAPSLNAIYDSSLLDENDATNDVYNGFDQDVAKMSSRTHVQISSSRPLREKLKNKNLWMLLFGKICVLGLSGIAFVNISENIHDNHLLTSNAASRPFALSCKVATEVFDSPEIPTTYIAFAWGVVLGTAQPVLDLIFPDCFTTKLFHLNSEKSSSSSIVAFSSIVRATIVPLGISFGLRNVDWESTLQASIAFSSLNICVWLLLDSTISGFIGCSSLAVLATASVVVFDDSNNVNDWKQVMDFQGLLAGDQEFLALNMFTASFFFCLLIIYGKIGRFLFRE